MSFLSIAFLATLPLLAMPILLHLFDRQRNIVIPWGAMQVLVEAATRQQSARRVQHWLLMLIRVAALAALILALARPLVPNAWLGGNGPRELIIVLGNSMSTTRVVEDRPLFDQLVERAEQRLTEAVAAWRDQKPEWVALQFAADAHRAIESTRAHAQQIATRLQQLSSPPRSGDTVSTEVPSEQVAQVLQMLDGTDYRTLGSLATNFLQGREALQAGWRERPPVYQSPTLPAHSNGFTKCDPSSRWRRSSC